MKTVEMELREQTGAENEEKSGISGAGQIMGMISWNPWPKWQEEKQKNECDWQYPGVCEYMPVPG